MTVINQKLSFLSPAQRRMLGASFFLLGAAFFVILVTCLLTLFSAYTRRSSSGGWYKPANAEELRLTKEKTERIRDGWRVWALAHQKELRQMLSGDRAAMLAAYDAIPVDMSKNRVDRYADLDFGPQDVHGGEIQFAWYAAAEKIAALHKVGPKDDPRLIKSVPKSIFNQHKIRDYNFGIRHDFPVLGSQTYGPVKYFLWASGRITKATQSEETKKNPTSYHQDVAPPFDFLSH